LLESVQNDFKKTNVFLSVLELMITMQPKIYEKYASDYEKALILRIFTNNI
jgi:hypothetical protein